MPVSGGAKRKGDKADKNRGSGREVLPHVFGGTGHQGSGHCVHFQPKNMARTQPDHAGWSPAGICQGHGSAARLKREGHVSSALGQGTAVAGSGEPEPVGPANSDQVRHNDPVMAGQ